MSDFGREVCVGGFRSDLGCGGSGEGFRNDRRGGVGRRGGDRSGLKGGVCGRGEGGLTSIHGQVSSLTHRCLEGLVEVCCVAQLAESVVCRN